MTTQPDPALGKLAPDKASPNRSAADKPAPSARRRAVFGGMGRVLAPIGQFLRALFGLVAAALTWGRAGAYLGYRLLLRLPLVVAMTPALLRLRKRIGFEINKYLPKGLYKRALLIFIVPIVLVQGVFAYLFMERHWQAVTARLSAALAQDVAAIVDLHQSYPLLREGEAFTRIAAQRLGLTVSVLPLEALPPPLPKPFFDIVDTALSEELRLRLRRPFWIDTVGSSVALEIRVALDDAVLRFSARRSQAYASNSHIFLLWMGGSSFVLFGLAFLLLRNQIRPILALTDAAEAFGKGRDVAFRPRGALEVRRAGYAFLEMRNRIERAIEQRTAMLGGVSHDLRTILTRFRLSLALVPESAEVEDMRRDVDEMNQMLEGYLAFVRGESAETPEITDIRALLTEFLADAERAGHPVTLTIAGEPEMQLRPRAVRRLLGNLVGNAARYGKNIELHVVHEEKFLFLLVDDDGPGIPEDKREEAFKPFTRLDEARNLDAAGTGLGLAIARDIARSHGGEITLETAPIGGLRARVRLPV